MSKAVFFVGALMVSAPASAGMIAPSPEAGAGFASLALLAGAYAYLRKRKAGN